jgi:hypothetical protein
MVPYIYIYIYIYVDSYVIACLQASEVPIGLTLKE